MKNTLTLLMVLSVAIGITSSCSSFSSSEKKEFKTYLKAAQKGDAEAQYHLGICYSAGIGTTRDYYMAAICYEYSARQGNSDGQNAFGNVFLDEHICHKNFKEAAKWFSLSAEQGNAIGQWNLGNLYYHGSGVPEDFEEAVKLYRLSAEQGYSNAQFAMGECYYYGEGVSKDLNEAVKWYSLAAENRNADAVEKLKILESENTNVDKTPGPNPSDRKSAEDKPVAKPKPEPTSQSTNVSTISNANSSGNKPTDNGPAPEPKSNPVSQSANKENSESSHNQGGTVVVINKQEPEIDEDPIPFQLVEEKPSFMGGDANKFSSWVNSKLQYPEIAKENRVQGRVILQFTVGKDGSVSDVIVLRGVDPSLDKEAVRVVSMSPKWTPGKQRDRAVKVTYTFPVVFQL